MHALNLLRDADSYDPPPVVVLAGGDRYLKQRAIAALVHLVAGEEIDAVDEEDDDDDLSLVRIAGKDADLKRVLDELRLISMWGSRKLILIESADDFVSKNRPGLEAYVQKPAKKNVLALDVKSFPKTTRLAKALAKTDAVVDCASLSETELAKHLVALAKGGHGKSLARSAASLMVQLAGSELGLLEQELEKLVSYVGAAKSITEEDVRLLVGGWRAETTWVMINALRDGQPEAALSALAQLLVSGEAPQKILGGIHFVFRKFAKATDLASLGESLNNALKQAGVFPRDVSASAQYLRRIGRPQAERISEWLLTADGNMKGERRSGERLELETLLVRLSGLAGAPADRA